MIPLVNLDNTCCFTGHRPNKLPWAFDEKDERCVALKTKMHDIIESVILSGIRHFICGMAQGCDMYFCEQVIALREKYTHISIEAAIPCETQSMRWSECMRNRYISLIEQCDYETLLQTAYTPDCMVKRNKYMVNHSSVLIAVFDGTFGGTMQTVNYAMKQKREIIQIKPC